MDSAYARRIQESFRAEEGKSKQNQDAVTTLQKIIRVLHIFCKGGKIFTTSSRFDFFYFLFLTVFFPFSPHVIVCTLYNLVICINFVVYNTPKEDFENKILDFN